jgi:hypothetical protein
MMKNIGLETSSIMPLLETTTRTLPLQQHIKETINRYDVEFYTDLYSVKEATQQINTSFNNAVRSIGKAKIVAERLNIKDMQTLSIIFVKSLSENWYGREETLRWSDAVINDKFQEIQNSEEFFKILNQQIENKKQKYLSMLKIKNQHLDINCEYIQSYWITPLFTKDLSLKIKTIPNNLSLEDFFKKLQSTVNAAYMGTLKINDVVDIYHLYSLYNDGNIKEVWSCNQQFVKRHEKYLKTVEEFKDLFDDNVVTIKRIK